MTYTI